MLNSISERPWTHISADFITKLPLAQGYNSILVVVDRLTKIVHFILTMEKTLAEGLARLFRDNVWKLHGLPESIISDRGPQFAAGLMKELNCKRTSNTRLRSLFQSSRVTLKPIQYYYVILCLTPIILRALHCHPTHFPCSDSGYQCRDVKTL